MILRLQVFLIGMSVAEILLDNSNQMVTCPDPYSAIEWDRRAIRICKKDPKKYHCLNSTDNAMKSVQFCTNPIHMPKGHFAVYRPKFNDINFESCPTDMYQPVPRMTNSPMAFKCERMKSQCNRPGEIQCDDGSSKSDRSCRCDYKNGYALEAVEDNKKNITCVHPRTIDLDCVQFNDCSVGQELNPYYQCVDKCPNGYQRQERTFKCIAVLFSSLTSTTSSTTKLEITEKVTVPGVTATGREKDSNKDTVVVIAISVLSVVFVVVGIILFKTFVCKGKTSKDGMPGFIHCCGSFSNHHESYNIQKVETLQIGDGGIINVESHDDATQDTPLISEENDDYVPPSKKEDVQKMKEHIASMNESANAAGMEVIDVKSDGSCFYHSVIYLTEMRMTVEKFRQDLKRFLTHKYDTYKDFISHEDLESPPQNHMNEESHWSELLRNIETSKWADHLEIKAVSDMLNLPINIYKLDDNKFVIEQSFTPSNSTSEAVNIGHVVIQGKGVHFVALKKISQ